MVLPQSGSTETPFPQPKERTYVRAYADIMTKFCRMDSLPNFLTHGAPLR